jgi:uncharacterized membrane protein
MSPGVAESWKFGGPLAGLAPEVAWAELAGVAAVGLLLVWLSYRQLRHLGVFKRFVLVALRTTLLAVLLVCLANPVRVERIRAVPPPPPAIAAPEAAKPRHLAVIVDRSDSMTRKDNRGRSRLDAALETWRRLQPVAEKTFPSVHYFSVAKDLRPATALAEAAGQQGGTGETQLYRSLAEMLKAYPAGQAPDGVVVLTDGLDTSSTAPGELEAAALSAKVPIYFVAGSNRSRMSPFLRVREWHSPGVVKPQTEFVLDATFEAFSLSDRSVPISLWLGAQRVTVATLKLTRGSNVVPWRFATRSGDPGLLTYTFRLGEAATDPIAARSVVRAVRSATHVLVYQSVLDWSESFLVNALRDDPDFQYVTLVDASSGLRIATSTGWGGQLVGGLPKKAEAYKRFDCVVLLHLYPQKLDADQQRALVDYVKGGGGVVFVSPDGAAMSQLAGSVLADVLPVVISPAEAATQQIGGNALADFELTRAGRASPIFANADSAVPLTPQFFEYTPFRTAKPGAEILAVRTPAISPEGAPFILLATQTFGRGRATLLTTDGLWRWKMSQPSTSQAYETFWQQLILAAASHSEPDVLRFVRSVQGAVGRTNLLGLAGAEAAQLPIVHAKAPSGRSSELVVKVTGDPDAPWSVAWAPDEPGVWELVAQLPNAFPAFLYPTAVAEATGEAASTPPALESLREIAAATGGALLTREPPEAWLPESARKKVEKPLEAVVKDQEHLRWNEWPMLIAALAIFGLELLLRRLWKLV